MRCEHELGNAAPGRHTYDVLFPILLSGVRDENENVQLEAIKAMPALILIAGENAIESSAEICQEFSNILSDEKSAPLVVRVFVDQFLPKIVRNLRSKNYRCSAVDGAFSCFNMRLNEDNLVLLSMLYSIIWIGFRKFVSRGQPTAEITAFLNICREKFGQLIDLAVAELPVAAKVQQFLDQPTASD